MDSHLEPMEVSQPTVWTVTESLFLTIALCNGKGAPTFFQTSPYCQYGLAGKYDHYRFGPLKASRQTVDEYRVLYEASVTREFGADKGFSSEPLSLTKRTSRGKGEMMHLV